MDDFHDERRRDEPEGSRDSQAHEGALGCQESYDLSGRRAHGQRNYLFHQLSFIFLIHSLFLFDYRAALKTNWTWNTLSKYIKINRKPLLVEKKK